MAPVTPFWFKQRQAKAEEAGPNLLRVSGPNLKEAFVGIRQGDGGLWSAYLRTSAEGPDVDATPATIEAAYAAWEAAFEMYRGHFVV
ncbi:MAG TPA: hypothetical protein VNX28_03270 [Gemmataceae bacterium]|nr:hypothetical protein [Gemmataceae bacterium]